MWTVFWRSAGMRRAVCRRKGGFSGTQRRFFSTPVRWESGQRLEEYDAERGVFVLKYERYDAERDVREWESEELPLAMESFEWLVYDPEDR